MEQSKQKQLVTTLAILIVVVVIVGGAVAFSKRKTSSSTDTATSSANTTTSSTTTSTSTSSSNYKDGTYQATGSYVSPGGTESITVSLTLKGNVISDSTVTSGAKDGEAQEYQSDFISGYKTLVVGKNINSVSLSRVSGSSLTSQGFNNALKQIKSEAAA